MKTNLERIEMMKQIYSFIHLEYRERVQFHVAAQWERKGANALLLSEKIEHKSCNEIILMEKLSSIIIYIYSVCSIRNLFSEQAKEL